MPDRHVSWGTLLMFQPVARLLHSPVALLARARRRRDTPLVLKIWEHFVAQPGFRQEVGSSIRELREGKGTPLRGIPRER